ncbi:iron ABC transporter permease [Desulfosporosinus sp. FKA]|uniref:FecCD family ABC transporter permease n=1 Tax=Desulfosporosinus sp. FKA TaxID=1969834 RepID=UPI001FA92CCA|nr:iron ABC transporter permease [Desulfosporosinus sp. FKA]
MKKSENKLKTSLQFPLISVMTALALLPLVAFLVSLSLGRYGIPLPQLMQILFGKLFGLAPTWPDTLEKVLFNVRIPRILCAMMVGAALAGSGAAYQGVFKNPMVSPDILGASAGAGFGAAFAILNNYNIIGIELTAFLFGIAAVALTYFLGQAIGRNMNAVLILVLTGMVVQSLFAAFTSVIKYEADPNNKLPEITFWLMGGLTSSTQKQVWMMIFPFLLGLVILFLLRWKINILSFGDEEAKALGIDTLKIRVILIMASTLLTSASIAISGMIGWVGLIIPHLARLIVGPNYKVLLPASVLMGAAFLLLVDDVARTVLVTEIPLSILTAIIGAPFFIYLLFKGRSSWE